jgi:hypothetical protein
MSRKIITHTERAKSLLSIDSEALTELSRWLNQELTNALSSRKPLESVWREVLRQYEGVPKRGVKNYPIENAPNTEITIGAIAADSIYAQAMDLKWLQTSPLITCRAVGSTDEDAKNAGAMQKWVNWVMVHEAGAREADDLATLDNIQLGTGIFYIPWVSYVKKTRTATITSRGPSVLPIPPEDCVVPGGSYGDVEALDLIGIRFWMTDAEIQERGLRNHWNLGSERPAGPDDWIRTRREMLSKHQKNIGRVGSLYDIYDVYCYFDIDGDGEREDLYIVYSYSGDHILHVAYNPFDHRPIVPFRYQTRPHVFWGLGVLEMIQPFEEAVTDLNNEAMANVILANERHWVGRDGVVPGNMRLRRNKITLVPNPKEDLVAIQMADIYPSSFQSQMQIMMLAEKRVGVNEMSNPRPSSIMGSRTPGITALTMMQQVNRRFTPAFDAMRRGLGDAAKQCMYRYQERLLAGDAEASAHVVRVLGNEDGFRVLSILKDPLFDEAITMELTASNPSTNREADRQNAIMLTNILERYYAQAIQLVMMAANPQVPQPVRDVAAKIAEKAEIVIDRVVRTFDQVRDPATFVLDVSEEFAALEQQMPGLALQQLGQLMSAGGPGGAGQAPPPLGIESGGVG